MKKYIQLLRKNRNIRLLSTVQLICQFGSWFSHTAIFTLLTQINAPVWAISLTAAMAFIPSVILAPFSGSIIEKFKIKNLLLCFLIFEACSVLMLLFVKSMDYFWLLEILVFTRMGTAAMYFQTEMTLLPRILDKEDLRTANELHSIIWSSCYTAGMGLAGAFIYFFGVRDSFLLDFCLYMVGIMLMLRLKIDEEESIEKGKKLFKMISEGLLYIKKNPLLIHLILIHGLIGATAYDALIALMAKYQYKEVLSASFVIGSMNMFRAIGLIIGPMILSKFTNEKTLFYLFLGQFAGIFIWAFLQFNFYIGILGMVCAGFFTSTIWSFTFTQIQTNCERTFQSRVIAWIDVIYLGISAGVSLAIGKLFDAGFSTKMITIFMSLIFLFGAFYCKKIYKKYLSNS